MLTGRIVDDDETWTSIRGTEQPVAIEYRVQVPITDVKAVGDDVRIRGPVYVGDDEMLDRHNELVDSDAILRAWDDYEKNPVILYNHSKTYGVIGLMENVEKGEYETPDGRTLSVPIGTALIDGGEDSIVRKIKKGMLRAFSIGFIAKAGVKECADEDSCYLKFTEIEWLETSVVDVPASPGALFSVEKSIVFGNGKSKAITYDRATQLSDFDKSEKSEACCGGCASNNEKHVIAVEETEDSYVIEFGKSDMDMPAEDAGYEDEKSTAEQLSEIKAEIANLRSLFKTDLLNTPLSQTPSQPPGENNMTDEEIQDEDLITVVEEASAEKSVVGGEGYPEDGKPVMPKDDPAPVEEAPAEEAPAEEPAKEEAPKKSSSKKTKSEDLEEEEELEEEESEEELEEEEEELEESEEEAEEEAEEELEEEEEAELPEEVVEESSDLPTTVEVLMHVAKGLDAVTDSVATLHAKFDENEALKTALTEAEARIASLTEEKAAIEQEKEIEAEVSKRLADVMAELGLKDATPVRKTLVETTAPTPSETDITRFDPTPKVTPGMNGLAKWLEARISER